MSITCNEMVLRGLIPEFARNAPESVVLRWGENEEIELSADRVIDSLRFQGCPDPVSVLMEWMVLGSLSLEEIQSLADESER